MKKTTIGIILFLLVWASLHAQGNPLARSNAFSDRRSSAKGENLGKGAAIGNTADSFLQMAKKYIIEEKFAEAKEALRTAIRIDPMNMEAWSLYDDAVVGDYIAMRRKSNLTPVIERDIAPLFSITRIDSYVELDTLYVVGSIKNTSKQFIQNIELTAKIIDENKRELRKATGNLKLSKKGLLPNESSLFEIPFKSPPTDGKIYRVEVSGYE